MITRHNAVCLAILAGIVLSVAPLSAANRARRLIVPGKSIGNIGLRTYPHGLPLGKPYASDAGMSHYHSVWIARRREGRRVVTDTTTVASVSNAALTGGPGEAVQCIRVTSPYFRTSWGLSTGSTLARIRTFERGLKPADGQPSVLEAAKSGIAFEFARPDLTPRSRCIAISVFCPGSPVIMDRTQVADLLKSRS